MKITIPHRAFDFVRECMPKDEKHLSVIKIVAFEKGENTQGEFAMGATDRINLVYYSSRGCRVGLRRFDHPEPGDQVIYISYKKAWASSAKQDIELTWEKHGFGTLFNLKRGRKVITFTNKEWRFPNTLSTALEEGENNLTVDFREYQQDLLEEFHTLFGGTALTPKDMFISPTGYVVGEKYVPELERHCGFQVKSAVKRPAWLFNEFEFNDGTEKLGMRLEYFFRIPAHKELKVQRKEKGPWMFVYPCLVFAVMPVLIPE